MESPDGQFAYARAHRLFASLGAELGSMDYLGHAPPIGNRRAPRRPIGAMLRIRTEDEIRRSRRQSPCFDNLIESRPEEVRYRAELARAYRDKAKVASERTCDRNRKSAVKLVDRTVRAIALGKQGLGSHSL